jgi:hypothetical protein
MRNATISRKLRFLTGDFRKEHKKYTVNILMLICFAGLVCPTLCVGQDRCPSARSRTDNSGRVVGNSAVYTWQEGSQCEAISSGDTIEISPVLNTD